MRADVVVVGAGIAGLTSALRLKQAGAEVAVVEADLVGHGVSGDNTAKASALQATVYSRPVRRHGADVAQGYGRANRQASRTLPRSPGSWPSTAT